MTAGTPLTTTDAICVPSAGLVFQVIPVSVHVVVATGKAAMVIAVPWVEELYFRGYLLPRRSTR